MVSLDKDRVSYFVYFVGDLIPRDFKEVVRLGLLGSEFRQVASEIHFNSC